MKTNPFLKIGNLLSGAVMFLLSAFGAEAQSTQTVRGRVIDEVSQTPLIGVNVIVSSDQSGQLGSTTDVNGEYRIEKVPEAGKP